MSTSRPLMHGRVALVTGASGGIGAQLAHRLADAGADVAVHYAHGRQRAEAVLAAVRSAARRAVAIPADLADGDEHVAVNLRAPFLLAQRCTPGMRERGFGRILFVSSVAALTGGVVGPHYAASKAALHG